MVKKPDIKTRKKLRITMCVLYLKGQCGRLGDRCLAF